MNSGWPPLTAGPLSSACDDEQLYRMRRIENDRRELPHDRGRPHIDHEIVVSKTRATFRQENLRVACLPALFHGMPHIPRRNKLALLDVNRAPAQGRRHNQVSLAAEKCRNLQYVSDFRHLNEVRGFMHIGQNGQIQFIFNFLGMRALLKPRPRKLRIDVRLAL